MTSLSSRPENACWIKALLKLVAHREFDEALAAVPYYPATTAAKIVACACLLEKGRVSAVDQRLAWLPFTPNDIPADLPRLLAASGSDFLARTNETLANGFNFACRLNLEFHLALHPESAPAMSVILAQVADRISRYSKLYRESFLSAVKRLADLDSSPARLIECASLCLRASEIEAKRAEFAVEILRVRIWKAFRQVMRNPGYRLRNCS